MSHNYELVQQLIDLVSTLYEESHGFLNSPEDQQLWYNRGYANGMISVLDGLGYDCRLRERVDPDPEDMIEGQEFMPWGKAYTHGIEMGEQECREIFNNQN